MGARGWAWVTLGVLVVAVVVVAALRVPWSAPPAPRADQLAALRDLPADAVARGKAFHAALRPGSYGVAGHRRSLIALVLGLTPLGARLVEAGRAALRRPLDRPGACSAASLLVLIGEVVDAAAGGLAGDRPARLRAVHPDLGQLDGRPAQGVRAWGPSSGRWRCSASSAWPGWPRAGGGPGSRPGRPRSRCCCSFVFPVLVEPIFNKFTPDGRRPAAAPS